ncbi:helix-turn-helix domain-containing protein [Methylobacter sp. S3L5C]|uniref:transcriptional regulator n=1 Tax=Methylobacter sp. S3L5C TaxID=2839024 RepID=UPI001FADF53D|nr:YdaS family helix-turn-helix protein [Methylobacter sp. S3L5C]UOA08348.1 helix-turn-helix domain-containing protein [Methylobacter sp. S3L5C]
MEKLIAYFNGSNTALALALGVTQPYISMCRSGKRKMNLSLAKKAESLTGIPREEIRPDIFGK